MDALSPFWKFALSAGVNTAKLARKTILAQLPANIAQKLNKSFTGSPFMKTIGFGRMSHEATLHGCAAH